ncbi:MAG: S8 family serine peptidase [Dehalococcoidia bacterium]
MKASYILATVAATAVIALLALTQTGRSAEAQLPPAFEQQSYIVVLKDDLFDPFGIMDTIERTQGIQSNLRFSFALSGFSVRLNAFQVEAIRRLPWVDFVSPDLQVQTVGPAPIASGETVPPGVRRIEAASTTQTTDPSTVNVAVIDTGIDLGHPDLNAVAGRNCVSSSSQPQDDNGHGTHVAGTIGGRNTGSGVLGVAPGTRLYAVKVLNSGGSGSWSQVICGIDWVTANAAALNIKVASMSLGGGGSNDNNCGNSNNDALHRAICNSVAAGVTYVVAAGNDGDNMSGFVPAAYPEVLSVTAMSDTDGRGGSLGSNPSCRSGEADDRYASFSNYAVSSGDIAHTIAGPGTCIYSTWVSTTTSGPWWNRTTTINHTYTTISGTSMATPHVSGSVALCFGTGGAGGPCTGMTPAQVISHMRTNAQNRSSTPGYGFNGDPNNPVSGRYYGYLVSNTVAAPTPDFSIAVSPSSRTVTPGGGANYTVTVTSLNGFNSPVTLDVQSGLPAGAGSSFTINPVTPTVGGATTTLNITTTGATPAGNSTLTIRGTSGALVHSTTTALEVVVPDFSVSASPSQASVNPGGGTSYTATVTGLNGFTDPVTLSVEGLPANASASIVTNPVNPTPGGATSTINISTTGSTPGGSYPLTIRGTSGALQRTASVTLNVGAPDFTLSVSPTSRSASRGWWFFTNSTTYTVTLTAQNGYNLPVALSVSGLGNGMTSGFSPASVIPTPGGAGSTLTIVLTSSATRGTRTLTITGVGSDNTTRSQQVSLTVN